MRAFRTCIVAGLAFATHSLAFGQSVGPVSSNTSQSTGIFELTAISRANCAIGVNESITWDLLETNWEMYTESNQFHPLDGIRYFDSGEDYYGWRSWAGCLNCGGSGWTVVGTHYVTASDDGTWSSQKDIWLREHCTGNYISSGSVYEDECWTTQATNCSIGS